MNEWFDQNDVQTQPMGLFVILDMFKGSGYHGGGKLTHCLQRPWVNTLFEAVFLFIPEVGGRFFFSDMERFQAGIN